MSLGKPLEDSNMVIDVTRNLLCVESWP